MFKKRRTARENLQSPKKREKRQRNREGANVQVCRMKKGPCSRSQSIVVFYDEEQLHF